MKKIFLPFLILLFPCFAVAQENNQAQKDSLRKVIAHTKDEQEQINVHMRLANLYYFEAIYDEQKRDTLFTIYDEIDVKAKKLGDNDSRGIIQINKLNILVGAQQYDVAIKLAPSFLAFAEKNQLWNAYFQLYNPYISAYRNQGKDDEALALAQKMYDYAKGIGNDLGMGMAFYSMAAIYGHQFRFTEQEKCLRDAITLLQNQIPAFNILTKCYDRLAICLVAQKRYDEAIKIADEMEPVIKRYEEASGSPQPSAWYNQCSTYLTAYYQSEQYDKAEIYCDKLEQMNNGQICYEERAGIFASRGQYKKALEMIDQAIESVKPTLVLQMKSAKMMILLQKEGSQESLELYNDIITSLISKHNADMSAQLDEIRTQYEVEKHIAEKERTRNYLLFALGGCLLLAIVLGIWIYHSRTIVKKNRGLYKQIKEQDRIAEELEAMTKQYEQVSQSISPAVDVETHNCTSLPGNNQQRHLVSRLREYLLKNNTFSNFNIEIQELISALATNRTYLFEALKAVTGKTPMEYISFMRLTEAKRLLDHSDLTIETIAFECGFNTASTLYRQFKEQYRITPTEYRKIAKELG